MEKSLLSIDIFKYERSKNVNCDKQYAQVMQLRQYVWATEWSMAAVRWEWSSESHSQFLSQASLYKIWQELLMMYRCRRLKMRTSFVVVPSERRRTGGSWAWSGWSLAENLQESLIIEEFDTREVDWVMRKMRVIHLRVQRWWQSERTWRSWFIAGIVWSCFRLWITWTIRPRSLECKVT